MDQSHPYRGIPLWIHEPIVGHGEQDKMHDPHGTQTTLAPNGPMLKQMASASSVKELPGDFRPYFGLVAKNCCKTMDGVV